MSTSEVLSPILGVNFDASDKTVKTHALGTLIETEDGNVLQYGRANGAVAQYALVAIDEAHDAVELTTTVSGAVPTAVGAAVVALADNEYGWFVRKGHAFTVLAAASCAADVKLYTTATAGVCDDTATDCIQGLRLNATNGGSQAAVAASSAIFMCTNGQD